MKRRLKNYSTNINYEKFIAKILEFITQHTKKNKAEYDNSTLTTSVDMKVIIKWGQFSLV